jgi:PhzF family phenazine biosynthesis protein
MLRYAAFSSDPRGGNPAGVVLGASGLQAGDMLRIAAEVGYSETAFLTAVDDGWGRARVRYFSPRAEVPFCGHASIASGVALAQRRGPGVVTLETVGGDVELRTRTEPDGTLVAVLRSVPTDLVDVAPADLDEALAALGWSAHDLDPGLPPKVAYAGAWHLVLAAASRSRLADLSYDVPRLGRLMADREWTTAHLVHRREPAVFDARDPFPPGGVVEDPATGAAAAAFGGYLRATGLLTPPARIRIYQGDDMGRPSLLTVDVPEGRGGVEVSGPAVPIPADLADAARPAQFSDGSSG